MGLFIHGNQFVAWQPYSEEAFMNPRSSKIDYPLNEIQY